AQELGVVRWALSTGHCLLGTSAVTGSYPLGARALSAGSWLVLVLVLVLAADCKDMSNALEQGATPRPIVQSPKA
ncbi:unnamed protein product, partial [Ilex paraguariensis]